MAWWGVAFALGPNYNLPLDAQRNQKALEAVQKAQSRTSDASDPERQQFDGTKSKVPADFLFNTNRAHDLLAIAYSVLDARLSAAAGDRNSAIAQWKRAVDLQDGLIYDEPPAWYYPLRESLGGEYLRAKRYAEAEKVFRRDLEINPNNARSLFGLREALRAQSKNAEAETVNRRFENEWLNADVLISVDTL